MSHLLAAMTRYDVSLAVQWLAGLIGLVVVLGSLASTTSFAVWWVRVWDFPRLQLCLGAAVVAAVFAAFAVRGGVTGLETVVVVLMAASAVWQAWRIWPYTRFGKKDVLRAKIRRPESMLRLVISNVLTTNRAYEQWHRVVAAEDPDVIAAAEVDADWVEHIDSQFRASHPYCKKCPLDNLYGLAIWSRLPLENVKLEFIVQDDIPSIHGTLILRDGTRVNFHCLHPRPPAPGESTSSGPRDAELVIVGRRVGENRDQRGTPTLVFGDLNDVAWSRTTHLFCKLSRLLDIRRGRGFYNTFNANSRLLRFPLDHIFISPEFRLVDLKVLPHVGSDHFPIGVRLAYEPDEQHLQPAESATPAEQHEATERAAAAG